MRLPVTAILFKRVTETNAKALSGEWRGEYDLRLGTEPEVGKFFDFLPSISPTGLGGWDKQVTFQPVDGPAPMAADTHNLRYMGPSSARKDYYFRSQRPDTAYPLWRPGRAFSKGKAPADVAGDLLLVIRDNKDALHSRWIRKADIPSLPGEVRQGIAGRDIGMVKMTPAQAETAPNAAATRVLEALRAHHNVLLYGPPATGKTHLVSEVLAAFGRAGGSVLIDTKEERMAAHSRG